MSDKDRRGALVRRKARIAEYIRQGKVVGEICDLEGLDPANEPRRIRTEVADPEGLTIALGHNKATAVGLEQVPRQFRVNLGKKLGDLRSRYHYVDVAQMTGMTNAEQLRAIPHVYTHNWTLAQIQRLAVASGMSFEEMMDYVIHNAAIADFRKKI